MRTIAPLVMTPAALQQEVVQLRQPPVTPAAPPPEAPAVHADDDREARSDLVDHAVGGEAPKDAMPEGPQDDLPRARVVDGYGSLRVAAAIDSEGSREIRNNSSRVGLRGSKRLTDGIAAFGRVEFGVNQATDALWLEAGYNDLRPDSGHPVEFRTRFGVGYVVYNFAAGSRLFGGFKLEDSRNSDGSKRLNSAFATGLNDTF